MNVLRVIFAKWKKMWRTFRVNGTLATEADGEKWDQKIIDTRYIDRN